MTDLSYVLVEILSAAVGGETSKAFGPCEFLLDGRQRDGWSADWSVSSASGQVHAFAGGEELGCFALDDPAFADRLRAALASIGVKLSTDWLS